MRVPFNRGECTEETEACHATSTHAGLGTFLPPCRSMTRSCANPPYGWLAMIAPCLSRPLLYYALLYTSSGPLILTRHNTYQHRALHQNRGAIDRGFPAKLTQVVPCSAPHLDVQFSPPCLELFLQGLQFGALLCHSILGCAQLFDPLVQTLLSWKCVCVHVCKC